MSKTDYLTNKSYKWYSNWNTDCWCHV